MGKISINLDMSGLKEAEEAFKQAAAIIELNSEDFKRVAESFVVPTSNWSSLKMPDRWGDINTISTSGERYLYHQDNNHNTYSILSDNYQIEITYNREYDNLTIQIVFLATDDTIEYSNLSKEHLFRLFDINNLLYQIDNVYKCVHCENTIIDNDEIKEHKELCIANILEDLEDNWNYIKWMR